jgi:hypothetical protein
MHSIYLHSNNANPIVKHHPNDIGYREHEVIDIVNGLGFNQAIEDDVDCDGFELGFVDYKTFFSFFFF